MAKVVTQGSGSVLVKSSPSSATQGQVAEALRIANEALTTAVNGGSVYGTEFHLFESNSVSTDNTGSFQNKISGVTSVLPAGKYKVSVSYGWNRSSSTLSEFESRLTFDGSVIGNSDGLMHKGRPDSYLTGTNVTGTSAAQRYAFNKTFYIDLASAATHTVELQYRSSAASAVSAIWDASVEIIRVS